MQKQKIVMMISQQRLQIKFPIIIPIPIQTSDKPITLFIKAPNPSFYDIKYGQPQIL